MARTAFARRGPLLPAPSSGEGPGDGSGTDLSAVGAYKELLDTWGLPGFTDPAAEDETLGWIALSAEASVLSVGHGTSGDTWAELVSNAFFSGIDGGWGDDGNGFTLGQTTSGTQLYMMAGAAQSDPMIDLRGPAFHTLWAFYPRYSDDEGNSVVEMFGWSDEASYEGAGGYGNEARFLYSVDSEDFAEVWLQATLNLGGGHTSGSWFLDVYSEPDDPTQNYAMFQVTAAQDQTVENSVIQVHRYDSTKVWGLNHDGSAVLGALGQLVTEVDPWSIPGFVDTAHTDFSMGWVGMTPGYQPDGMMPDFVLGYGADGDLFVELYVTGGGPAFDLYNGPNGAEVTLHAQEYGRVLVHAATGQTEPVFELKDDTDTAFYQIFQDGTIVGGVEGGGSIPQPYAYQGEWATGTAYTVGQAVYFVDGNAGTGIYIASRSIEADVDPTDDDWTLLADGNGIEGVIFPVVLGTQVDPRLVAHVDGTGFGTVTDNSWVYIDASAIDPADWRLWQQLGSPSSPMWVQSGSVSHGTDDPAGAGHTHDATFYFQHDGGGSFIAVWMMTGSGDNDWADLATVSGGRLINGGGAEPIDGVIGGLDAPLGTLAMWRHEPDPATGKAMVKWGVEGNNWSELGLPAALGVYVDVTSWGGPGWLSPSGLDGSSYWLDMSPNNGFVAGYGTDNNIWASLYANATGANLSLGFYESGVANVEIQAGANTDGTYLLMNKTPSQVQPMLRLYDEDGEAPLLRFGQNSDFGSGSMVLSIGEPLDGGSAGWVAAGRSPEGNAFVQLGQADGSKVINVLATSTYNQLYMDTVFEQDTALIFIQGQDGSPAAPIFEVHPQGGEWTSMTLDSDGDDFPETVFNVRVLGGATGTGDIQLDVYRDAGTPANSYASLKVQADVNQTGYPLVDLVGVSNTTVWSVDADPGNMHHLGINYSLEDSGRYVIVANPDQAIALVATATGQIHLDASTAEQVLILTPGGNTAFNAAGVTFPGLITSPTVAIGEDGLLYTNVTDETNTTVLAVYPTNFALSVKDAVTTQDVARIVATPDNLQFRWANADVSQSNSWLLNVDGTTITGPLGVNGVAPPAQPALPTTLEEVITILTNVGLCAAV